MVSATSFVASRVRGPGAAAATRTKSTPLERVFEPVAGRVTGVDLMMRTLDLSLSGMLIQGENELAVGDQFAFELHLPGVSSAIVGSAEVVRHTDRDRETVIGVGATFASFVGDGRTSLADFLTKNNN